MYNEDIQAMKVIYKRWSYLLALLGSFLESGQLQRMHPRLKVKVKHQSNLLGHVLIKRRLGQRSNIPYTILYIL